MTRADLIENLHTLCRHLREQDLGVAASVCERAAETITTDARAVEAWEAIELRRWFVVPKLSVDRKPKWAIYNAMGDPFSGQWHDDPIAAVLNSDAAEKARQG